MPIISKETWDKFTQEEKDAIRGFYKGTVSDILKTEYKELFGKENLQPQLTYENVVRELFFEKESYCIDTYSRIVGQKLGYLDGIKNANNCTSQKQAEKLLAINKLLNVARFLNGKDWKHDEIDGKLWTIGIEKYNKTIMPVEVGAYDFRTEIVYFPTQQLTQQAIQILGEDTVRLALTTEY